jgi:hypothetical protein
LYTSGTRKKSDPTLGERIGREGGVVVAFMRKMPLLVNQVGMLLTMMELLFSETLEAAAAAAAGMMGLGFRDDMKKKKKQQEIWNWCLFCPQENNLLQLWCVPQEICNCTQHFLIMTLQEDCLSSLL